MVYKEISIMNDSREVKRICRRYHGSDKFAEVFRERGRIWVNIRGLHEIDVGHISRGVHWISSHCDYEGVVSKWHDDSPMNLMLCNKQMRDEVTTSICESNTFEIHNTLKGSQYPMALVLSREIHHVAEHMTKVSLYFIISRCTSTAAQIDWPLIGTMKKLKVFRVAFYWTTLSKPRCVGRSAQWRTSPVLVGLVLDIVSNIPRSVDLQWGAILEVLDAAHSQPDFLNVGLEFIHGQLLEDIATRFEAFRGKAAPR